MRDPKCDANGASFIDLRELFQTPAVLEALLAIRRLQEKLMQVQVDTTVTIKIDDVPHKMTMDDARRLYAELGKLFPASQHYHPRYRYAENRAGGGIDPLNGKYSASASLDPLDFAFEFKSSEG